MSYTVCKKCSWWEADHRRGLCCRKCGSNYPDLRKTTGGAKTGWYTIESKGTGRAKRKPQPAAAWQGWKSNSWTGWEDTAGGDTGGDKELISKLLQLCKEGKPLTEELETLASRAVEPADDKKSDKELEQQCWKTLERARIELKRKQEQLAKKTKAVEKAQEFLKAAEEVEKEAKTEQDTANAAVDAATAAYAVFKSGRPQEDEEEEHDEQDKRGDEELAAKLAEHEESTKKLKEILGKRKAEAEAKASAMEIDDNKRKEQEEQQERDDKAAKHRRLSDELEKAKAEADRADKAAKEAAHLAKEAAAAKAAADKAAARG